jgi:AcrR family transcriptional regulator
MNTDNVIFFTDAKAARADAVRNRRRLLETAQRLFNEQSVETITMSDIAKSAGVGKGTLYRHFSDKADLCHALLDEAMRDFQLQTLQQMGNLGQPYATLRWFIEAAASYVYRHTALLNEVATQGNPIAMLQHPAHIWWRQTILGLLERLQPAGDIGYLADVLYLLLDVQTMRFQLAQGYTLDRIVAGLLMTMDKLLQMPSPS